jgi:ubiquinone/menaquinone biosynthesis C-methylase UbiE
MRLWERVMFAGARRWVCAQARGAVLEVAVGTGLNLAFYPPDVSIIGVDLSRAMPDITGRRADRLGRWVLLVQADAQALPLADCSFDTVVCTLGLCSANDERAVIDQMWRVLRPGGRLLLLDHTAAPNRVLRAGQRLFERVTARLAADYQIRRLSPLLWEAGFVIERSERSKAGTVERIRTVRP